MESHYTLYLKSTKVFADFVIVLDGILAVITVLLQYSDARFPPCPKFHECFELPLLMVPAVCERFLKLYGLRFRLSTP